jgi:2-iminobutanoate/2-iminopropanoate deaminase
MTRVVPDLPGIQPGNSPYSEVVEADGLVFLAGQVASDDSADFEAQARAAFDRVGELLSAAGLDYSNVVRCTVYLIDFGDFEAMSAVFREYFPSSPPTRTTLGVTALARKCRIELEVTAAR